HDELGIEAGLDFVHASYGYNYGFGSYEWSYNEFTPVVGVTWNFWLSDRFAVYPKVDFGYRFSSWSYSVDGEERGDLGHAALSSVYFQGAGGVVYRLGSVALRAEAGWYMLRVGASIAVM